MVENRIDIIANMIRSNIAKTTGLPGCLIKEITDYYISKTPEAYKFPDLSSEIYAVDAWIVKRYVIPSPFVDFWYGGVDSAQDIAKMLAGAWLYLYKCPAAYDLLAALLRYHDDTCRPYTDEVMARFMHTLVPSEWPQLM